MRCAVLSLLASVALAADDDRMRDAITAASITNPKLVDYATLWSQVRGAADNLHEKPVSTTDNKNKSHTGQFTVSISNYGTSAWGQTLSYVSISIIDDKKKTDPDDLPRTIYVPLDTTATQTQSYTALFLLKQLLHWTQAGALPWRTAEALIGQRIDVIISTNPDAMTWALACSLVLSGPIKSPQQMAKDWSLTQWQSACNNAPTAFYDPVAVSFLPTLSSSSSTASPEAKKLYELLSKSDKIKAVLAVDTGGIARAFAYPPDTIKYPSGSVAAGWWPHATALRLMAVGTSLFGRPLQATGDSRQVDAGHLCTWYASINTDALCVTFQLGPDVSAVTLPFDTAEASAATLDLTSNVVRGWSNQGTDQWVQVRYVIAEQQDAFPVGQIPLGWDDDADGVSDVIDVDLGPDASPPVYLTSAVIGILAGILFCILGTLCLGSLGTLLCICFCPCCARCVKRKHVLQLPDALGGRIELPGLPILPVRLVGTAGFDMSGGSRGGADVEFDRVDQHERLDDEETGDGGVDKGRRDGH